MSDSPPLTYTDPRGDLYTIWLDAQGVFLRAERLVERATMDPITYDELSELPPSARIAIEHLIWTQSDKS